jgi:5-methylcytosine-specific restriction endonuclease McrA
MPYAALSDRRRCKREYAQRRRDKRDPNDLWYTLNAARRHVRKVSDWVREKKLERGCAHCGYRVNGDALEFDHIVSRRITGDKQIMINSFVSVRAALANPNVQVLCANCHAIKSVGERRITIDPS